MSSPSFIRLLLVLCVLMAAAGAAENAALAKYGAEVAVTCNSAKPLNAKWAGPGELMNERNPAGPIINDMATAKITLSFPVPLSVKQIGLMHSRMQDKWLRATEIEVQVDGKAVHTLKMELENGKLQLFDIPVVKTDKLMLVVTKVDTASSKLAYGGFTQLVAIVEEDLKTLFASPTAGQERPPFIMATANLGARPKIAVQGQPRKVTGHPCTIWDAQDIAELKQQIATIPAAKDAYQRCIAFCDQSVAKPVVVPDKPDDDIDKSLAAGHTTAVGAIANLGIGYALSGDERYAKEVRRMLLRYSELYESWPVHASPKFTHDKSRWSWQRLNDAIWLIQAAWGYDLIYNSPALSDADRTQINDHFMKPCVNEILRSSSIIAAQANWSVICCAAVMIGSRVSGYDEKYEWAVNGLPKRGGGKAPAPAVEAGGDAPSGNNGGIFYFIDKGIDDDGMWAEGTLGYQFMAIRGLAVMAEICWRDGIDVYGYRNGRLKLVFDSPIWYCYPGGSSAPVVHDGGGGSLFGRDAHLYQYAMRRYGDGTYKAILGRITPSLTSVYNLFLPAFDFTPTQATDLPVIPSITFPGVGFAIARTGEGVDERYLFLDHGPNRSHGHPDKLNHTLFALGQELYADSGSAWYATDVQKQYYSHTLAHNTVLANGQRQIATGGRMEAYAQAGELALIRASCNSAIPSAGLDRTLVMLGDRLYDIFPVRSSVPYTFDLPLHSHGTIAPSTELEGVLKPWTAEDAGKGAYAYFSDPRAASLATDWSCTWQVARGSMQLRAIGEPGTEVVFAYAPMGGGKLGTVMLRRQTKDTVFATVSDIIPSGKAASVRTLRALRAATAYGLEAELADGDAESVLVNLGTTAYTLGEWSSDAGVAVVRRRGAAVTALILSGGTTVSGPGLSFTLSVPGLVSAYAVKDGLIRVTNHGDKEVEVVWQGLAAGQIASLDTAGKWLGRKPQVGGRFTVPAAAAVDLSSGGDESVAVFENARRVAKQKAAWEVEQKRLAEQAAEMAALREQAKKEPIPAGYLVVIEAETPAAQGGGEVTYPTNKAGAHGTCISQWNNRGHWLEYAAEVAHTGWYQVGIKYCLEGDDAQRAVLIDGKPLHPSIELVTVPGTGGWSNGGDQWRLLPISRPGSDVPMLVRLEAGKHVIRLENRSGGGLNVDYLTLMSPETTMARSLIEK